MWIICLASLRSAKDVAKASGHAGSSSTSKRYVQFTFNVCLRINISAYSYETLELLAENTIIEYLNMNDDVLQKLINDKIVDEEKLARCILYSMRWVTPSLYHILSERAVLVHRKLTTYSTKMNWTLLYGMKGMNWRRSCFQYSMCSDMTVDMSDDDLFSQKFLRQWDGMNIQYSGIWVTEHLVITRNDLASEYVCFTSHQ